MNVRTLRDTILCLILVGAMCAGACFPATVTAKEPKRGKKAEKSNLPEEGKELEVKAADLVKVTYKGPAHVQTLTQTGPKRWKGAGLLFDEVERDEFSVYLARAKADKERAQIDLHTRMVTFSGTGPEESYPILSASGREN